MNDPDPTDGGNAFAPEPLPQVAALPIRRQKDGTLRVLLMTSRDTGRWVIPKGWPMKALKDHKAAAKEAREEAGLVGRVGKKPLGTYLYWKRRDAALDLCRVTVYLLVVRRRIKSFREKGQRNLRWVPVLEAAGLVREHGLRDIILKQMDRVAVAEP